MTISLFTMLCIYGVLVAAVIIFILLNVFHIVQSASMTLVSFSATMVLLALMALVFFFTWWLLQDTDWQTPVFSTETFLRWGSDNADSL